MTTDQLLADAVGAARAWAERGVEDGAATHLRLRESRTTHRRRLTIIAAVIASLFGSTAFALVARQRSAAPPAPAPAIAPAISEPAAAEPPHVRVERQLTVDRPALPPAVRPPPRTPHAVAIAPQPEVKIEMPRSRELAAYRVAHEAHFRGADLDAALRAWDDYLAQYPSGKLAVDARYSRALILVKLKRWSDARAALRPLAEAPAGSYRQAEAAKLLAALP